MSESLPRLDIGDMNLYERDTDSEQSIADSHACVCESTWIDDNDTCNSSRSMYSVDQGSFMV